MSIYYREFHFWSPTFGGDAVRLSMAGNGNKEYFAIVARAPDGTGWREQRDRALQQIEDAIVDGAEPGEVALRDDT